MKEIQEILTKHDIAGTVFLYDDHMGEYLQHITTSKSVMQIENSSRGVGLRFRSKKEHFNGNLEAQQKHTEYSIGMLRILSDMMAHSAVTLDNVYNELAKHYEITHSEGVHA